MGGNTPPAIIKFPFWRMTAENLRVTYACVNLGEAVASQEIDRRAVLLDADAAEIVDAPRG